jgi:hypothetical protein
MTISTFLGECTSSSSKSRKCAIVESTIYLTVLEGREDESRAEALSVINHKLEKGDYETGSVEYTHYLGPDVAELSAYLQRKSTNTSALSSESSSTSYLFYGAIATVSIAICALLVFGVLMARNRKKQRESIHYERFANNSSYPDHQQAHSQSLHYSASPQLKNNRMHSSELSDWRSLVGRERF